MPYYRRYSAFTAAHRLTLGVYEATASFPRDERFGLVSQLRRAAYSIPANLAEGSGRGSDKDFARFLRISTGSVNELEYGLKLAADLGMLDRDTHSSLASMAAEARRMLVGLTKRLSR